MREYVSRGLPCSGCETLNMDVGLTYEELEGVGAIREGKMIRHFKDCSFADEAYSRVTGKQVLSLIASKPFWSITAAFARSTPMAGWEFAAYGVIFMFIAFVVLLLAGSLDWIGW